MFITEWSATYRLPWHRFLFFQWPSGLLGSEGGMEEIRPYVELALAADDGDTTQSPAKTNFFDAVSQGTVASDIIYIQ